MKVQALQLREVWSLIDVCLTGDLSAPLPSHLCVQMHIHLCFWAFVTAVQCDVTG